MTLTEDDVKLLRLSVVLFESTIIDETDEVLHSAMSARLHELTERIITNARVIPTTPTARVRPTLTLVKDTP